MSAPMKSAVEPSAPNPPLISVITVCFNAIQTLPKTCESLFQQNFKDFEWVVVDGASNDGTVEWLEHKRASMSAYVSEKDGGIYDAMNKAIRLSRGQWVLFLNADDRLTDIDVLSDVAKALINAPENVGLVYGDAIYTDGDKEWLRSFSWVNSRNLVYGDLCHQVIFAKRELFETVGRFDLTLRFNADFDWLLRVTRQGYQMQYLQRNIAYFYKGGAHVKAAVACELERFVVRHRYKSPISWRIGNFMLRVQLKMQRLWGGSV